MAWFVPIGLLLAGVLLLFFILRNWQTQANIKTPEHGAVEPEEIDAGELAQYRQPLEKKLAAADPIFARARTEANYCNCSQSSCQRCSVQIPCPSRFTRSNSSR